VPVPVRGIVDTALRRQAASVKTRHLGVDPTLIYKHKLAAIPELLKLPPDCAFFLNVSAILLPCVESFFYSCIPTWTGLALQS
jgi:hypothetical protein